MEYALNRLIETDGRTTKPDEKELVKTLCPSCKQNSITLLENNTVLTTNQETLFPGTAALRRRTVDFGDPQERLDSVIFSFKPSYLQDTKSPTTDKDKDVSKEVEKDTSTQAQEKEKSASVAGSDVGKKAPAKKKKKIKNINNLNSKDT